MDILVFFGQISNVAWQFIADYISKNPLEFLAAGCVIFLILPLLHLIFFTDYSKLVH